MAAVRSLLNTKSTALFYSTYDDRPSKLFDGMHHCRLAIILSQRKVSDVRPIVATTKYHKWYQEERPVLFPCIGYLPLNRSYDNGVIPKFRSALELNVF